MKLVRPESSGFVKNIQTNSEQGRSMNQGIRAGKKPVKEKDLVFWIPSGKIIEIDKNSQGLTTDVHLASGAGFVPVNYIGSFKHSAKKQGLSRVSHHLELGLAEGDELRENAEEIISKNVKISILHLDRYGDGFFYGEDNGLSVIDFNGKIMVLDGTEDNVFYELAHECLNKIIPKTEQ